MAEPFLIAFFFFFLFPIAWVAFEILHSRRRSAPGVPDDVVEWLLAVYLLVCRSQHGILEFRGTTAFHPPPPISKYIQLVNQTWQPSGLWLSDCVCLGSSELLACFPSSEVYSNSDNQIRLAKAHAGRGLAG